MKTTVAICKNHQLALEALTKLKEGGFPLNKVSLVAKARIVEDHIDVKDTEPAKNAPLIVGASIGPVLGLLTGIGIFAIPGLGFLYGAGAIVGILGGLDLGVLTGGFITLLATLGIEDEHRLKFEEHLEKGDYLIFVDGSDSEIHQAREILHTEIDHLEPV